MVRADPVLQPAEHLVWLCVGLTAAPSVALWGWAGRRWGNERAFAVGCLIEAVGVALSVLGGGIWLILLAAGLLGGTFVGLTAIGLIEARHRSTGDPRRNLALMTAAWGLGQMVGPTLAGVLFDALGSYLGVAAGRGRARRRRRAGREPVVAHEHHVNVRGRRPETAGRIAELLACFASALDNEEDRSRGPE